MAGKEYKLKQWYPSLRNDMKEGDIVEKCPYKLRTEQGKSESYIFRGELAPYFIPSYEVENNPEFWEKVEPKDYEILSVRAVKRPSIGEVYTDVKDHLDYYLEQIEKGRDEIYSVKRLSDGRVFTIGDRVTGTFGSEFTIRGFEINPEAGGQMMVLAKDPEEPSLRASSIGGISHVKKPLFTTADGIDIYEGDRFWAVTPGLYVKPYRAGDLVIVDSIERFESKKKAEEYIEEHRVRYSRADVKRAVAERIVEVFDCEPVSRETGEPYVKKMARTLMEKMDNYE